jgi:hypothetical protein
VEALRPLTLLLDEVDAFAQKNEELRGVLNSGFEASGAVIRVVERDGQYEPVQCATFAPLLLASIGAIPGTLADRALPVRMERKAVADTVTRLRDPGARRMQCEPSGASWRGGLRMTACNSLPAPISRAP